MLGHRADGVFAREKAEAQPEGDGHGDGGDEDVGEVRHDVERPASGSYHKGPFGAWRMVPCDCDRVTLHFRGFLHAVCADAQ